MALRQECVMGPVVACRGWAFLPIDHLGMNEKTSQGAKRSLPIDCLSSHGDNTLEERRDFFGGLVVRIWHFHCCGLGLVPGQETEIPKAVWHGQKTEKDHFIKPSGFTDKKPKATEDLPPIMKKVSVRTQGSQVKLQCLSTYFLYYTLGGRNEYKFCLFPNRSHFLHVDFNDVSMPGADIMKATCLLKRELKKEVSKSLEGNFQCLPYAHPCVSQLPRPLAPQLFWLICRPI